MAGVTALEVREIRATALGEAEAYLSHSYCDHRLAPEDKTDTVDFRHRRIAIGGCGFNFLQYGHEVSVSSGGFEEFYMFEAPVAGGVDITFGNEKIRSESGKALILSPGPKFCSRWREGTRQWMLQIDRKLIEHRLAELAHRRDGGTPVFNPIIDLTSPHGRYFASMLRAFSEMLAEDADPVGLDAIEAALSSLVDEILRNTAFTRGSAIVPERLHASPRHVKQAMDALKSRYAERLLMPVIASEIGVSERVLYEGFQTHYQRTPYEILTRIRMEAARRLMRESGLSAAEAAKRVGIRHLGRFAATYREMFGVLPSADLRGER